MPTRRSGLHKISRGELQLTKQLRGHGADGLVKDTNFRNEWSERLRKIT